MQQFIDTDIRHVTPPGPNLFAELGFPAEEAARLHAEARQQVKDALALKAAQKRESDSFPLKTRGA